MAAALLCSGPVLLYANQVPHISPLLKECPPDASASMTEFIKEGQNDFWRDAKLTGVEAKLLNSSLPEGSRLVLPPSLAVGHLATLSVVSPQGDRLEGAVVVIANHKHTSDSNGQVSFIVPEGVSTVEARIKDFKGARTFRMAVAPAPSGSGPNKPPAITDAPRYPVSGADITIEGGPFDGSAGGNIIRIGSRDIPVLASSPTSLVVATPTDWPSGDSGPLTVSTQYGASPSKPITFIRIRMEAGNTNLLKGESAKGRIIIEGTQERLQLRITNLTPNVIQLKGGDTLTVRTSGGSRNAADIKFTGVTPGGFTINAEVIADKHSN